MTRQDQPSSDKRPPRYRLLLALAGIAGVAVVAGWMLYTPPGNALAPPAAPVESDGAFRPSEAQWFGFKFAKVEALAFREERATDGRIAINEDTTTPVFSPYSGRVSRLIAKPGERVERGAPLFAIEASEFVQGHNDLITAVAGVEKAKSKLVLAQAAEKRQRELLAIRGGALKDFEQAQSDLVQAQGDLRAADIALAAVRNRLRILGRSDEEISELEKRDRVGAETIVSAPIGGTVIQRKVGLGQYINAGANDPVYTIGDLSTVWLVANVRESDAPRMRVGAPVQVTVLAFPGQVFNARLSYVAPALDPNTRRLPVRAEIDNPNLKLKPEMFASFRIISGDDRSMPAVPVDAIVYEGANARVWVARPDSKTVVSRAIVVGDTSNGMVEVKKGLDVGETVVTSGTLFIDRAARRD
ncbi:MAG: efflux RND transporter periplasmic adaptor subunit [Rhodospirillales bacterium]|nr:efflux RND transporter periplasmic adaptor subunit [Rhodospirillales bacterium]